MTRRSKIILTGFGAIVLVILFFVHGCEHIENTTISFPPPLGNVEFHSFSVLEWVTSPSQEINIRLKQQSDVKSLLDLRVFGDFQPEMTDEVVIARFGKPQQTRADNFGGSWSRYPTPLGYVEIGVDRRTSPTDDDEKSPPPGRRSVQAHTDKPLDEIFLPLLVDVVRKAQKMTPRAEARELSIFDLEHKLILDMWMKNGRIDHMELFRHIDR